MGLHNRPISHSKHMLQWNKSIPAIPLVGWLRCFFVCTCAVDRFLTACICYSETKAPPLSPLVGLPRCFFVCAHVNQIHAKQKTALERLITTARICTWVISNKGSANCATFRLRNSTFPQCNVKKQLMASVFQGLSIWAVWLPVRMSLHQNFLVTKDWEMSIKKLA